MSDKGGEVVDKGRRRFMVLSVLGGGALTLGLYLGFGGEKTKGPKEVWAGAEGFAPNAWLRIDAKGRVTVRIKHCEMGQGTTTGLSAMVAEELEVPWDRVGFEIAPVEAVYKNPATGVQQTGGSTATPYSWDPLRRAGASAREMLISAAASVWGVPAGQCRAREGRVVHPPTGRALDYGGLVDKAARIAPPPDPPLKKPSEYKLIGQPLPRLDTWDKITGRAVFGQDVKLPGLAVAYVIHPPVIGARLEGFQADRALKMPGGYRGRAHRRRPGRGRRELLAGLPGRRGRGSPLVRRAGGPLQRGPLGQMAPGRPDRGGQGAAPGGRPGRGPLPGRQNPGGRIPGPLAGPRHPGAHELHGPRGAGPLPHLGPHPEPGCLPGGRGPYLRPGLRQGGGLHHLRGRRVRPPDRARLRGRGGGALPEAEAPGQGHVEPGGGHGQRLLPPGQPPPAPGRTGPGGGP